MSIRNMTFESTPRDSRQRSDLLDQSQGGPQARIKPANWSTFPFLRLSLQYLPQGTTTLEIYNNFQKYGNINKIEIVGNKSDDRGTFAEICFEPPPTYPIWERGRINFTTNTGYTKSISIRVSPKQPTNFQRESPIHQGVYYNDRTVLLGSSLTWGILTSPKVMMTMAKTDVKEEQVRLVLNLRWREIMVEFPYEFRSENRSAIRLFRFKIALDENFTIWKLPDGQYVLHLSNIPWYSKQLKEAIAQSHSRGAKLWFEEDTWARQTDIFDHKSKFELINQSPVSLEKNLSSINIARWTTFLVKLLNTKENMVADDIFGKALKDFNVNICDGQDFKIVEGSSEPDLRAWRLLNGRYENAQPLTLAEEMSQSHLPFSVRYQLEVCLSLGWLSEYQITTEFLETLGNTEESQAKQMLVFVDSYQQRVWEPMSIFRDIRYRQPVKFRPLPEHCIEVYSAVVTATSIIWNAPTVEITNRVIRRHKHHADRFLRVRFEDDSYRGQSRLFATPNNKMILVFQRVKRVLQHGIKLGDRHYEFLAWGNSQLREHGAYFFARGGDVTAANIRAEMGAFDQEKVVAKRAARMGQCFSTTRPVHLRLPAITLATTIPDIKHGNFTFTDGVGKISPLAAHIVHQQLKIKGPTPSVFQFRLGGCKGVLTVWPDLTGVDVQVRASQFKFNSTSGDLEIIRWSEFWQPFLNRQIITCLSHLGVPDKVFLEKQNEMIESINAAMEDDKAAVKALRDSIDPNLMTLSLVDLVEAGFRSSEEPFVVSILHLWKAWSLKYLKEKAKIPVPKGAFLLGCVDETNTLRGHYDKLKPRPDASVEERMRTLPEIFLQITNPHNNRREVIEGVCVLARNPSLHEGDIRIVKAVDVPALRHLCDVVIMPANGDRDLPSMCSGGDLDGDDYMVFWDQDLVPAVWNAEPFHYNAPPPKTAAGEITTNDIINFFYDYLQNDYLGRIAHAHLGAADYLDEGIRSSTCLELVNLHSMAVDYPKTGVPAIMERRFERPKWPHFMEKKSSSYISHKVLGQLYDAVKRVSFHPTHGSPFDERILKYQQVPEQMARAVEHLKRDYDGALQRIMTQHNIKTEFEVWSTFVLDHSKASRDFKFHEEIGQLSSALKEQYYEACCEVAGGKDFQHLAPVAVAAYQYTSAVVAAAKAEVESGSQSLGSDRWPFISFPWILKDTLCRIGRNYNISGPVSNSISVGHVSKALHTSRGRASDQGSSVKAHCEGADSIQDSGVALSLYGPQLSGNSHVRDIGRSSISRTIATPEDVVMSTTEPSPYQDTTAKAQAVIAVTKRQEQSEDWTATQSIRIVEQEPWTTSQAREEITISDTGSSTDPLYMTTEQLQHLGLPLDMEL